MVLKFRWPHGYVHYIIAGGSHPLLRAQTHARGDYTFVARLLLTQLFKFDATGATIKISSHGPIPQRQRTPLP